MRLREDRKEEALPLNTQLWGCNLASLVPADTYRSGPRTSPTQLQTTMVHWRALDVCVKFANSRKIAERGNPDKKWPCRPTTEALHEIEIGKVGRELLEQIAKEK